METATGPGAECAHVTVFWPMKSCRPMSPGDRSENNKKLFSLYSDNNHFLYIYIYITTKRERSQYQLCSPMQSMQSDVVISPMQLLITPVFFLFSMIKYERSSQLFEYSGAYIPDVRTRRRVCRRTCRWESPPSSPSPYFPVHGSCSSRRPSASVRRPSRARRPRLVPTRWHWRTRTTTYLTFTGKPTPK